MNWFCAGRARVRVGCYQPDVLPPVRPAHGRCDFGHAVRVITDPRLLLPKAHRFPDVVADKRARIHDRHVAPLNRLVEEINAGREAHLAPWFDPDRGGTSARVLFLLEKPGRRATSARGSGFISADNNDDTAATFFRLRDEASLPRVGPHEVIHLGGEAAVVVPVAEYRRLRALEDLASAQELEDAETAAALDEYREWSAAGRPGEIAHEEARRLLLGGQ